MPWSQQPRRHGWGSTLLLSMALTCHRSWDSPGSHQAEEGSPGCHGGTSPELSLLCLQAENTALAQANENQRETYERCLDEVPEGCVCVGVWVCV